MRNAVGLVDRPVSYALAELGSDSALVRMEAIAGYFRHVDDALTEIGEKFMRVAAVTLPRETRNDGTGQSQQHDVRILIAHGSGSQFILADTRLLLGDTAQ